MTGEFLLKGNDETIARFAISEVERNARNTSLHEVESYWSFLNRIIDGSFGKLDIAGPGGIDLRLTGASFLRDHLGADENVVDINRNNDRFEVVIGRKLRGFFEDKFGVIVNNDQPYAEFVKDQYSMIDAIGAALQYEAIKKEIE